MREEQEQDGERKRWCIFLEGFPPHPFFFFYLNMAGRSGGPDSKVVKYPNVKITSKGSSTYQAAAARQRRVNEKLPKKFPQPGWCSVSCCSGRGLAWKPRGQLKHPKVRVFRNCRVSHGKILQSRVCAP